MRDVVVIGAGMAGVTAGRDCREAGLDVVVVEATDRVGGRVHTDRELCALPVERGAEFIHTDEAPTLDEARAAGLELLRCDPGDGFRMVIGGRRDEDLLADPDLAAMGDLLGDVERWDGPDTSAAEVLEGRGVGGLARVLADQMLTIHPLGDLFELSMAGLRDDRVVELERGIDHRVAAGYDALPAWIGRDLEVRFHFEVGQVDRSTRKVRVHAADGEVIEAHTAICTLPVGVLKAGSVRFEPELPAAKLRALLGLDMGAVLKILYRFSERFWPEDLTMLGCDGPVRLYWTPAYGRSGGDQAPVLTAYVSGHRARALSAMTEADAVAVGLADLDRLFPAERPSQLVRDARRVDWCTNPFTRGGYSFVRLGGVGARAALAASDTGALLWAGDATSTTTIASVVHAAYATGRRAAREVIARLGGPR